MTTARTSRLDAEVLVEADTTARVSRIEAEVLAVTPAKARLSRLEAEALVNYPVLARLSRLSVEVLVPKPPVYFTEATADDALISGDVAVGTIAWAGRTGTDGTSEPLDAEAHTSFLARAGADTAGGTDALVAVRTTFATAADLVPTPTDAAVSAIRHFFVRYGVEHLDRPYDSVEHLTFVSEFRPSFEAPGRRLVRVKPNQANIGPTATNWSSDVAVSKPRAYSTDRPVLVDFGGFGFTTGGIAHNITESQVEEQFMPIFSPEEVDDGS